MTLISEHAYHDFPLFKFFRESDEFLNAYNEIYGHEFIKELKRMTDEDRTEGDEEIIKIKKIITDDCGVCCEQEN